MKKEKMAFTLLEIMIVIAIVGIIIIWATSFSFNSLSDRQRVNWFFYKIKNNIETIKNNVLIWREVKDNGNNIVSNKWQIDFNNSGDGFIKTYYYNSSNSKINYPKYDIIPDKSYAIIIKNDWAKIDDIASILIQWKNLTLTWAWVNWNDKVLEVLVKYKNQEKIFTINAISWVIEEK